MCLENKQTAFIASIIKILYEIVKAKSLCSCGSTTLVTCSTASSTAHYIARILHYTSSINKSNINFQTFTEKEPKQKLVELTQYEEIQLLKQVEGLIAKVKEPSKKAYLHRLKAKLALRRLKRHKHLPLFNLDRWVIFILILIYFDTPTTQWSTKVCSSKHMSLTPVR